MSDMGVNLPDIEAKITIDTDCIESVRERAEDDTEEICSNTCMIHMKSGDSYQVGKSYPDMIKWWNRGESNRTASVYHP
jgi:hypothetical protein